MKKIDMNKVKPQDMMKYEIAKELGLFERVIKNGWGSLTAGETGRIGGIVAKRKKDSEGGNKNAKENAIYIQSNSREGENKS